MMTRVQTKKKDSLFWRKGMIKTGIIACVVVVLMCFICSSAALADPTITITTPTSADTWTHTSYSLALGGSATVDSGRSFDRIEWFSDRDESGFAIGTTSWTVPHITLFDGETVITVTVYDNVGYTATDVITVTVAGADTENPTVTIQDPTASPTYSTSTSPIVVGGQGSDNVGVTQLTWANNRGGSGTATISWSGTVGGIPSVIWGAIGIVLQSGSNGITITARDAAGNSSTDTITITYTPSDTVAPTATITSPTTAPTYATASPSLTLAGTATDNVGVTQVTWANDRGGSGTASGTTSWIATGITLQSGSNVITITAQDAAGNSSTDTITVTYTPADTIAPTATIISPTTASTYATASPALTLAGTATDNVGVTQVTWANNHGESGTASGTTSWTAAGLELQPGSNIITITSRDAAGNTGTDTITVTYTPPDTIAPTVTITSPTTASTYTTTSLSLTLAGTATDNVGVTQVTWVNNRGGSGTTVGTTSWTAAGIALQPGSNIITITSRDAAGNSGTDALTVNCTPPAGAFSVTPSPSTTSVVEGQNNIVASTYSALAVGGGSFTVTSDQGSFLTQGGTQLGTVDTSVSIKVVSGRGMSNETITVPPKYITAALNQKANRIIYQRIFTYGGDSAISEVTMQIVPVSAGAFTITRLALRFEGEPSPGRATVARNALCPTVFADLTYTGSGMLRAQWKVDGQILGFVTQQLYPGIEKVSIKSPDVPPFPTYAMGRHSVEFELIEPTPGFTEPVVYYDVTEGDGGIAPGLIRLISPADNATVPMPSGPGSYPEFRWQAVNTKYTYRFEIIPGGLRAEKTPLVMAEMATGSYTLSQMDVECLSQSLPYRWRVRAYNGQKIIGASVFRAVYFSAPEGTEGNIEFRNLNITEMPEETSFLRWLLPKSAYAEEGGQTGEAVFNVTAGKTVVITTDLANDTNVTKTDIRVEFVVDGEVVDVSFVQSLAPDETVTVEGVYEVSDAKTHTLEIRAVEGEGEAAEILASVSGSLEGGEAAPTKGTPQGDENRLAIGDFTIQLTEVTNDDTNNFAGSGTIDVPFIGGTLNVTFQGLQVNGSRTIVQSGTVEVIPSPSWEHEIAPAVIAINAFTFAHDRATCQGHVEIAMPFASLDDKLVMDFTDVGIHPDNGFSGTVTLAQDFTVGLPGIQGFGISLAQGSSVTLTKNGINSSLNGSVTLPDEILEPVSASGIDFSALAIKSDGGFIGTAALGNSSISGTNFGINGTVTLDFTTMESPGVKSEDKTWMGVYVSSANLAMPSDIPIPDIAISNLYIDSGLNGTFEGDLNPQPGFEFGSGDDSTTFSGNISKIAITFSNYRVDGGTISGSLEGSVTIPYVNLEVGMKAQIGVGGVSLQVSLPEEEEKEMILAEVIKMSLIPKQSFLLLEDDGIRAELRCKISSLGGLGGATSNLETTFYIASNGEIGLKDTGGNFNYWYNLGDNIGVSFLDVFSLQIQSIGFGYNLGGDLSFGVKGGLNILPGGVLDVEAEAEIGIKIPSGDIYANDIHVDATQAGVFSIKGNVSYMDGADKWGDGFKGGVALTVSGLCEAELNLIVGSAPRSEGGSFPYFYFDGYVGFTPGIPLTMPVPLSIYGFGGGVYCNMMPPEEQGGDYQLHEGNYGIKAWATLGTNFDDGYTYHGNLGIEVQIATEGPIQGIEFTVFGESYLMCKLGEDDPSRLIYAEGSFSTMTGHEGFSFLVQADNFALVDPDAAIVAVTGEADIKFAADDWHVYMGRKEDPATVAILPFLTGDDNGIGRAQGYFEIDKLGVRAGYLVQIDTGRKWLLVFYGRVWGGESADFGLSFDPMYVYAEFAVWMGLEAGVGIKGLGSFEIFYAEAMLAGGVRTPNPTQIWVRGSLAYRLLGGIVSGTWSMTFTLGETVPVELAKEWPCFDVFDPGKDTEGVDLGKPIKVVMTTPEGRKISFQDEKGELLDVKVTLKRFEVYCETCVSAGPKVPVPGEMRWDDAHMSFVFEPEEFLWPNSTYRVEAKAVASGSILESYSYFDTKVFTFTSGDLPNTIDLLIEDSYPKNGRKYSYTAIPIYVKLKRSFPLLNDVVGKLFKEDGTEVPGSYTVGSDYRSFSFRPDNALDTNTFYEFKLMKGVVAHSDNEGEEAASDAGGARPLTHNTTVQGNVFMAELVEALGDTWLTLKFETGAYSGFKAMMEASNLNLSVTCPEVCSDAEVDNLWSSPEYTVSFTTVEPFYWDEIWAYVRQPSTDSEELPEACRAGCVVSCQTRFYPASDTEECSGTVSGLRHVIRDARSGLSPKMIGAGAQSGEGVRNNFRLAVYYGPFRIVREPTDCDYYVQLWERDMSHPQEVSHGVIPPMVNPGCRACLNSYLIEASTAGMRHKYEQKEVEMALALPSLPTNPGQCNEGGEPEPTDLGPSLVVTTPKHMEIHDDNFGDPAYQKPVFLDDLFGPVGDIIDDIPWTTDEGGDLVNEFNGLAQQYQEMVDEFGAMNFGPDLNKQYDTLTQQYSNLGEQYNTLSRQAAGVSEKDVNYQDVMKAFQNLNAGFQNLNDSFMDLNRGRDLY